MALDRIVAEIVRSPERLVGPLGACPITLTPLAGGNVAYVFKATFADGRVRVLKFSDSYAWLRAEQLFLETWANIGIATPLIYDCHKLHQDPEVALLIMEHLVGQNLFPLMEAGKVASDTVLSDLGALQAQMHQPTAHGYGRPIIADGSDNVSGASTNLQAALAQGEWAEAIAANRLSGDLGPDEVTDEMTLVQQAAHILDEQRGGQGSCYAHSDFRGGNIIYNPTAQHPYTVIDPNPELTHPYLCLAYSLLLTEIHGRDDPSHLLRGYAKITAITDEALHAALMLKALVLLPRWGRPGEPYAEALRAVYRREKLLVQKLI